MKDKEMRDILIEYIKSVSDHLTGYEIKSDADNYQRLEYQKICNLSQTL